MIATGNQNRVIQDRVILMNNAEICRHTQSYRACLKAGGQSYPAAAHVPAGGDPV